MMKIIKIISDKVLDPCALPGSNAYQFDSFTKSLRINLFDSSKIKIKVRQKVI
jgi:16S rRNA C967 or C1407 C5-methylase (RsmB/RsmF family)